MPKRTNILRSGLSTIHFEQLEDRRLLAGLTAVDNDMK